MSLNLFLPNNLSRAAVELMPVDVVLESQVRDVLRNGFGRSQISSVKAVTNAGILSSNFVVQDGVGMLVVKARPGLGAVGGRLEREIALADRLRVSGIPVPSALGLVDGRHVVEAYQASWTCYQYCAGTYFQGLPGQLQAAACGYARLSAALRDHAPDWDDGFSEAMLIDDLYALVRETPAPPTDDRDMAALYLAHRDELLRVIARVAVARETWEENCMVMHTDYHPLNVLMDGERLSAILDFEDIKRYPVAAGSGFAAYKLIRQTLVRMAGAERPRQAQSLANIWIREWSRHLPELPLNARALGEGALYRVLGLLQLMFDAWLRKRDTRFNFDFPKQMGSLYEIGMIFDLGLQLGDC